MNKIIYTPTIEFEEFKSIKNLQFEDYYSSVFNFEVDISKPKTKSIIQGRPSICAFCGSEKSHATPFSDDAHVIPAFFNDPKLFSTEECNTCNHKFGEELENELAKMLNPLLITSQILPRKGNSRKAKTLKSRVEFNKNSGLEIRTQENFTVDTENGNLSISIPRETFNPQKALRSLLHTFWLAIDINDRKTLPWIIEILNDSSQKVPSAIYFGFNISGNKEITLKIFKKTESEDNICDYIMKIDFGLYFLYYGIYYPKFKPILIEPISMDESIPIPPSIQIIDFKEIKKINAGNQSFMYGFKEFRKGQEGEIGKVGKSDEILVSLWINGSEKINKTKVTTFKDGKTIINGYDFAAMLIFSPIKEENKFEFKPNGISILDLKKTIEFLQIANEYKEFNIKPLTGGPELTISAVEFSVPDYFVEIINSLYTISVKLNKNINFNSSLESNNFNSALWLSPILDKGVSIGNKLEVDVNDQNFINKFLKDTKGKKNLISNYFGPDIVIMDKIYKLVDIIQIHCVDINSIKEKDGKIIIEADDIRFEQKKRECITIA